VEHGHTVPAIETLEKFARALEVPMYQLFYEGEEPPKLPNLPKRKTRADIAWGSKDKDARLLAQFIRLFSRMEESDLGMVLFMAQKMARRKVGGLKLGLLLLQFGYFNRKAFLGVNDFLARLRPFLKKLPKDHKFAVEIRNKNWLVPQFVETLR
jgi:hypothetical protein